MRLIDADEFDRWLADYEFSAALLRAYDEDKSFKQETMYYSTQSFRDVMQYQPTLKVIPVEWIKQKMNDPDLYARDCAKWMLECWKREQEEIK